MLTLGPRQLSAGLISRRSELRSLEKQIIDVQRKIDHIEDAREKLERLIAEGEQSLQKLVVQHRESSEALGECRQREHRYIQDVANWGESDRWAAPAEFFARGGDCEDYAIAKYFALRELGVPSERLRIVVLHDRQRGRTHAVLAVTWEHRTLVLDNLRDRIVPWRELPHYLPIYSLNERSAWLYAGADFLANQRPGG